MTDSTKLTESVQAVAHRCASMSPYSVALPGRGSGYASSAWPAGCPEGEAGRSAGR